MAAHGAYLPPVLIPEWFKDAKFGIWAHWGPQCQAEDGDWYARFMYYAGSGQYNYHVNHFGNPKDFGLKDLCNAWTWLEPSQQYDGNLTSRQSKPATMTSMPSCAASMPPW